MKRINALSALICLLFASVSWAQQAIVGPKLPDAQLGTTLYDAFNGRWLNPAKWIAMNPGNPDYQEACYFSSNVMECVREIQDGKLRLAVKSYGATDTSVGGQYGEAKLMFPQPFVSFTADVAMKSTTSVVCAVTGTASWADASVTATFFNSGSGSSNDDASASLALDHSATDPPGVVNVKAVMYWEGQYINGVTVGSTTVGTPIRLTLRWVQPSHKFSLSFENLVTGQHFAADMPYTMSDTMPPTGYWNGLYVQAFPANCVGQQTSSQVEATFDNVILGN